MNIKFIYLYVILIASFVVFIRIISETKLLFGYEYLQDFHSLTGPKVNLDAKWLGQKSVYRNLPILILAGHADSQNSQGRGTSGEAVGLFGSNPMNLDISDELFWNLKVLERIVSLGKRKGLNISSYIPQHRNIVNPNHPDSNWSVGEIYSSLGWYVIEIHFDAYGMYGIGSGIIPPITSLKNEIDEQLGISFGRFPVLYRGGLGAPKRGIRVLEIGKLEGILENNLRDPETRNMTLNIISRRFIYSFLRTLNRSDEFNPLPHKDNTFLPAIYF